MTDRKDYEVSVEPTGRQDAIPDWYTRGYAIAEKLDAHLGVRFWSLVGLLLVSIFVGTPHILVTYQCYGRCGQAATEFNCQYFGVWGWRTGQAEQGKCARFTLM